MMMEEMSRSLVRMTRARIQTRRIPLPDFVVPEDYQQLLTKCLSALDLKRVKRERQVPILTPKTLSGAVGTTFQRSP